MSDLSDYGFDKSLSRPVNSQSTGTVYDIIESAIGPGQMLSGESLDVRALTPGGLFRQVAPGDDLQAAVDAVARGGGGRVQLTEGAYIIRKDIIVQSGVSIQGIGARTIVDFDGTSHGFLVVGSNPYSTGTAAVTNDGMTIVGTGTTWTIDMIGQSILVGDYWYVIADVGSTTSITPSTPYIGETKSALPYVIATTIDAVIFKDILITNSSATLMFVRYSNNLILDNVLISGANIGFDGKDSSFIFLLNGSVDTCDYGIKLVNHHYGMLINYGSISNTSYGIYADTFRNWALFALSVENNGINGINVRSCTNTGFDGMSVRNNGSHGVEAVSGVEGVTFLNTSFSKNGGDGIKLTATCDRNVINANDFDQNGGYGINIAASTDDYNIIGLNTYNANTLGTYNDLGTNTTIVAGGAHTSAGVYTPTRSNESNLDSSVTVFQSQYLRVGNTVTVSGRFIADPRAATVTAFQLTLPFASNIGANEDLCGTAFCDSVQQGASIFGEPTNDKAKFQWIANNTVAQSWSYTFTYRVI